MVRDPPLSSAPVTAIPVRRTSEGTPQVEHLTEAEINEMEKADEMAREAENKATAHAPLHDSC